MPLFLADIHLHHARLFGRPASGAIGEPYRWQSLAADLAAARRLIEKHGYLRRRAGRRGSCREELGGPVEISVTSCATRKTLFAM